MPAASGKIETTLRDGTLLLSASGHWTIKTATILETSIAKLALNKNTATSIDFSKLDAIDTAGALLIRRLYQRLEQSGNPTSVVGLRDVHAALIERIGIKNKSEPLQPENAYHPLIAMVERTGRAACTAWEEAADLLYFLGVTSTAIVLSLLRPSRIRFISVLSNMERVGLNLMPIVGLLSFLIGIVVAFQGADQLRQFGAEIFTVAY
jgi:phospholipid/cholesterol/gamma-HCH transport system permease protein